MNNIGLKKKYSSLKMNNITVIKLKTLAKQRGIKDYCQLRKTELIQTLEAHSDVNEQVLIPELEIPRNTTRSVNTSAILDDPILDDNTPVLQTTPNFIAKAYKRSKILVIGCWIVGQRCFDEALESFKNLIKKLYNKRDTFFQLRESKSVLKKFAIQYRVDGKDWIDPDLFLLNSKQTYYKPYDQHTTN